MTYRSIPTIDPGGVATQRAAEGEGIVVAILGTGVDAKHPHFARHANFVLPPPLQHYDVTLILNQDENPDENPFLSRWRDEDSSEDATLAYLAKLDHRLLNDEALIARADHTTHVAGIVAGHVEQNDPGVEWEMGESSMRGVAPKAKLLILKVLDDKGAGSELTVLGALEVVHGINARAGKLAVPVVLIPLSIAHDVMNFACGHSPVCEAVDRLIGSGVVVICPAGNSGYLRVSAPYGTVELGRRMGITDPGNAERAITVGATHRSRPQEYGASYFSSRGPTLDGRLKPDLLAPGEKINSAVPSSHVAPDAKGKRKGPKRQSAPYAMKDGTDMAAAHVAGAVAALLSVRPDLIGHPEEVKKLLLSTATDLGRPPEFQGRGLLNLSRALGGDDAIVESGRPAQKPAPLPAGGPAQIVVDARAASSAFGAGPKPFTLAVSFIGEHREYVYHVVHAFREATGLDRENIFYDKYHPHVCSRPDLDLYLLDVYGEQSELIVVFLGAGYDEKPWTGGLEWRAIRSLIMNRQADTIMPVRLDDSPIKGLLGVDGYLTAYKREQPSYRADPEFIAEAIVKRLRANRKAR